MWFIGVEVEQETSAPTPKKNPGSAPGQSAKSLKGKGKGIPGAWEASFSLAYGLVPKLPSPYERLPLRLSSMYVAHGKFDVCLWPKW